MAFTGLFVRYSIIEKAYQVSAVGDVHSQPQTNAQSAHDNSFLNNVECLSSA